MSTALALSNVRYWDGVARGYMPDTALSISPTLRLHAAEGESVDPITFEVIRYSLMNANFEHSRLIQRLSVSPIVMMARDFQASVLLEDGELVCLGPNIQYFANAQSLTVKWILENRSDSPGIRPGDMFLCNDPYIGAPHQQDATLAMPVFVDGALFCWIANTLHYTDVGGIAPGSFCYAATDAWSDPPAFAPMKLVEGDRIRLDVEEVFTRQSRMRINVKMDLRAAVSANQATAQRIRALIDRYGAGPVKTVMRRTIAASGELFAERLRQIPDGTWSASTCIECCVPGDWGLYRYQITIRKQGDQLFVDNKGTDKQAGAINITFVAFAGAVLTALVQAIIPDSAGAHGGAFAHVTFEPVAGLLNCAEFPAAVSPSGSITSEVNVNLATHVVARMLACGDDASRARILGTPQPAFYAPIILAFDDKGHALVMPTTDNFIGTQGGMPEMDGADGGGHTWMPGCLAENVEQVESQFPLLYLYRRFMDGGHDGAGRTRGGLGQVQATIPWNTAGFFLPVSFSEAFTRANGVMGGNPGSRAWTRIVGKSDVKRRLAAGQIVQDPDDVEGVNEVVPPKACDLQVDADGILEWSGGATAGFGDPLLRDPQACLADVEAGLFRQGMVRDVHGVVIIDTASGLQVDGEATGRMRKQLREARLGRPTTGTPKPLPVGARRAGDLLYRHGGRWLCGECTTDLGEVSGNYKVATAIRRFPIGTFAPGFDSPHERLTSQLEFRMFLCPVCGVRFDTEIARKTDPLLHDIVIRE